MKLLITIVSVLALTSCNKDNVKHKPDFKVQYTLIYNNNGATSGDNPTAITADANTDIILNSGDSFSKNGYTFAGWNIDANSTLKNYIAGSSYKLIDNITLYAKWEAINNDTNTMKITIGSTTFTATFVSGPTIDAFKSMLPLTLMMNDFNSNEKVCYLPKSLPTDASNIGKIHNGDIMLYGSNSIVLFYKTFSTSYRYTKIATIDNISGLYQALGSDNVLVKFEI